MRIILNRKSQPMDADPELSSNLPERANRLTRQRQLVLDILAHTPGHPNAARIYQQAVQRDERISLATVYRALDYLKEAGLVEEDSFGEDHGHFETVQEPHHYHFTCLGCGEVIELNIPELLTLVQTTSAQRSLQVTETYLYLRGYCPNCQQKNASTRAEAVHLSEAQTGLRHPATETVEYRAPQTALSALKAGQSGLVCHLTGGKNFMSRLAALGFTLGAQVNVLHNQGQGPLIVSILGAHIALGRQEAERVQIQPL